MGLDHHDGGLVKSFDHLQAETHNPISLLSRWLRSKCKTGLMGPLITKPFVVDGKMSGLGLPQTHPSARAYTPKKNASASLESDLPFSLTN